MATRCSFCFQERQSLRTVIPNTEPVCNGCARSIDGVLGWLSFQTLAAEAFEIAIDGQMQAARDNPPTPQEPANDPLEPGDEGYQYPMGQGPTKKRR